MYNLTDNQKEFLRWLVQQVRDEKLREEFYITWVSGGTVYMSGYKDRANIPKVTMGVLDALAANNLLLCTIKYREGREEGRRCVLTGKAYEAVDSNFNAPDTSFVKHLTSLADVTNFDTELKERCLPILGAGSTDPKLWDSAVRTAGVILEERLRDVGKITNPSRVGRELVNDVFGQNGTLATKLPNDAERQGYRDMYAGVVGVFRNPYAHRLIDPTPEDGGTFIALVNLLLKMLGDLR